MRRDEARPGEERVLSSRLLSDGRSGVRLTVEQLRAREEYLRAFGPDDHRWLERCPGCGSAEPVLIARKDVYGLPADNYLCRGCGLIYKNPVLTPEATVRYYRRISARLRGKGSSVAERERLFRNRAENLAPPRFRFVRERVPELKPGALVVEIGTHDGGNLLPWREAGFRTVGFDIDEEAFAPGRAAGLDLRAGAPGEIRLEESPQLVLLSHFVEHLDDPLRGMGAIRDLFGGSGSLFVEVPGAREWGRRDLLGYFMAEHNFSFDLSSLRTMMAAAGFGLVHGDEFVRAVFRPQEPNRSFPWAGGNAEGLLRELEASERWCRTWTLRRAYHVVRSFAFNDIVFPLIFRAGDGGRKRGGI